MRLLTVISGAALLLGCSTPVVMLKNDATGQVGRCGGGSAGSIGGGYIGYSLQVDDDEACARDYEAMGFRRFRPGEAASSAPAAATSNSLPPGRVRCRFPSGTIITTDAFACTGSLQGEIIQ